VLYSGNLGRFQDFDTLLDAAERLGAESHIEFRILGQGARQGDLRREIDRRRLTNVTLEDFKDEEAFREELRHAHLGVVTLEPELEGIGVPSKTYNLLAAGVPLCAVMGGSSEVAQIIDEYRCGVRVGHGESDALAAAIVELQRDEGRWRAMSNAARRYVDEKAALPVLAARYRRVLEACAGGGSRTQ
jgi:glycosyltransferase involved in cell wall biosynthesis